MGLDLSDLAARFKAYCESPRIGDQPILTFLAETREYVWGELRNGDRHLFKGFLESNHDLNADTFADLLLDELSNWSEHPKGIGQTDDITLMAINF
jgi:hypothetical protein